MLEFDEILQAERVEPKTFHPVNERSSDAWFPGNEAASLVIQIRHIWDDIHVLQKAYGAQSDPDSAKLLLKYAVIEVRSLVEVFDRLQSYVFKAPIFDPKEKQGWREITQEEHNKAKALLKKYSKAKSASIQKIIKIRNEIGAHRGNLDWQKVMMFWDSVTPELIHPILDAVPEAFDYIKSLDLFEWNRCKPNGHYEFLSSQIRPEYFENTDGTFKL